MLLIKEILVILPSDGLGRQLEAMKDKNCFAGLNHLLARLIKILCFKVAGGWILYSPSP